MNEPGPTADSRDSVWPEDINEWEDWPEPIDIDYVCAQVERLTLKTFKNVLLEEVLDGDEALILASAAAEKHADPVERMKWLQEPLYNPGLWPEWRGEGFWVEYLELIWRVMSEAARLQGPEQASSALRALMDDPDVWTFPTGPAAIVAQCPITASSVNDILRTFLDAWGRTPEGAYEFQFSDALDRDWDTIHLAAPLLAITCLHPEADPKLVTQVASVCTEAPDEVSVLGDHFWTYTASCLHLGDEERLSVCPDSVWSSGFVVGLGDRQPPIGPTQLDALATLLIKNYSAWAPRFSGCGTDALETAAAAFAERTDLADELLGQLAASSIPSVHQAILANPAASEKTRTLAALHV